LSTRTQRTQVDAKVPVFNRGVTYQTKEKGLTVVTIKFVGGVSDNNNKWRSGCCIVFVLVGTESRA
jgi:hypothetical protein